MFWLRNKKIIINIGLITLTLYLLELITFANSLDPDQARQNVLPDLGPSCLTLIVFLKEFLKKKFFDYGLSLIISESATTVGSTHQCGHHDPSICYPCKHRVCAAPHSRHLIFHCGWIWLHSSLHHTAAT